MFLLVSEKNGGIALSGESASLMLTSR